MEGSRTVIHVLWPSFLVAGVAEGVFFTLVDPAGLHLLGSPVATSDLAAYTIGFFVFWAFAAASSALTCFLQRSAAQINRMRPIPETAAQAAEAPPRFEAGGSR